MTIEIRVYRPSDREAVITLWNEAFFLPGGHNEPAFAIDRKARADDGLFFVATDRESVVGTVIAGYDGHRGWLYSLAVLRTHRRRGIATELVRHAETCLIERGCPKVNLQVRSDNESVVAFYQSLGFHTEPRISMGKRLPVRSETAET